MRKNENVIKNPINLDDIEEVEMLPGVFRKTLAYNEDIMICRFRMIKNAKIDLHNHPNSQNGYIISGKVRFFTENSDFIAQTGDGYVFSKDEKHGADILEDTFLIEAFTPSRPEYKPKTNK